MTHEPYTPPKVWQWNAKSGGAFANINRPVAGPTHEKVLPLGKHPLQLYSLATPNGMKATIMLEELLALGHKGAEYDAHLIQISDGDQFSSGFVNINPNSKIPAMVDQSVTPNLRVFESGSILLYLADKFQALIPQAIGPRTECLSWLFWQIGTGPLLGGGFGHFYTYAPEKYEYPINRYTMEVKRQLDVLDRQLAQPRACPATACRSSMDSTWFTLSRITKRPFTLPMPWMKSVRMLAPKLGGGSMSCVSMSSTSLTVSTTTPMT